MKGIGADQTLLADQPYIDQAQLGLTVQNSQVMYDYKKNNTWNGVPVQDQARDLPIDNADLLIGALKLNQRAKVWTGYISPQESDRKYVEEYAQLKQSQSQGQLVIYTQDKQFCPSLNKFLILLTYAEVSYGLNERYKYLKEEDTNG